jgi:hypothetical protein
MKLKNVLIYALVAFILYRTFFAREGFMNMTTTNIIILAVGVIVILGAFAYVLPQLLQ